MDEPKYPPDDEEATRRPADRTRLTHDTRVDGPSSGNRAVDPSGRVTRPRRRRRRYRKGSVLGRGGMGEVHVARDRRIGRSVAIKVMLDEASRADQRSRFVREARVQGQLEHPSIVPVYDLGWDRAGRPYFAMKRVAGVTLADVLRELRRRNPEYESKYSLRRLLSNFQQVCLALEFAHARGVVHRDVKPSNVMFGDFGEVYILDWGIAKVARATDTDQDTLRLSGRRSGETGADEVLGTLGYMAPEQITAASTADPRADVYALGAVLFQILTLEPLHGYGSAAERAQSTLEGADARASRRAPGRDVPPELDAICVRATSLDPSDRYPSARALHDAVEGFLEGDRDTRLRRELSDQHVANARHALEKMLAPGDKYAAYRKRALAEAGRALALDPKNDVAAGMVARLMLESPREIPPEVRAAHEEILRRELRKGMRLGALSLLAVVVGSVFLPLLGAIRSYAAVAVILCAIGVAGLYALARSTSHAQVAPRDLLLVSVPICVAIAAFSLIVGPLVVPPILAMGFASLIAITRWLGRYRIALIAMACASWLVPSALDWLGLWLEPAYRFEGGVMIVVPRMMEIPEAATRGGLMALFLAVTIVVSGLLWLYSTWVADSRERLHLHAWHLENVVPREPDPRSSPSSRPPPPPIPLEPPDSRDAPLSTRS